MTRREHVCNATVPVCHCGRRWEYRVRNTTTYTSKAVRDKHVALYGGPEVYIAMPEEETP